jgi:hypothetical protein
MKEFKKNKQKLFICEECNNTYKRIQSLSKHISLIHYNNKKEYYDKWLKDKNDNMCKICNRETKFNNLNSGYKNCCSEKCSFKYTSRQIEISKFKNHGNKNYNNREKCKQTNFEKYGMYYTATQEYKNTLLKNFGVENVFQLETVKEKIKQTTLKNHGVEYAMQSKEVKEKGKQTKKEKYGNEYYTNREKSSETCFKHFGVKNPLQSKEIRNKGKQTKKEKYGDENYTNLEKTKQTKQKRYGDENYNNKEKTKQTNLKNHGVECSFQCKETKEKGKQTCLKNYGVEHPNQNKEIFEKAQKNAFKIKYFRNTNIYYRGSYEFDFLEKYYNKYPDIQNAQSIKYKFNENQHYYFPDFYIPSLNLIIECKNSYLVKRDKLQIKAKKKATIINDFKYIMIINKNYNDFNKM